MVGTTIGSYQVLRLIGKGGMGTVYEGLQQPIGRRVAIKVLHPEYAADKEVVKRFFNEARAANLIAHPSIVQISDFGQLPSGAPYLVMEYLEGETLADRLVRSGGRLPEEYSLHIIWQIASALEVAHARGIVHRDLKPSNVMLIHDSVMPSKERAKVVDLGIAKLEGLITARGTRSGSVLGTPLYMSPEQCKGANQVDGKADVYSLGVMLYELLSGSPPFMADSDLALLNMHVSKPLPPLMQRAPSVSSEAVSLVECMLRKKAAERISMAGLVKLLTKLGSTQSREQAALLPVPTGIEPVDPLAKTGEQDEAKAAPPSSSGEKYSMHRRRWTWRFMTAALFGGLGMLGVAAFMVRSWSNRQERPGPARSGTAVSTLGAAPLVDAGTPPTQDLAIRLAAGKTPVEVVTTPPGALVLNAEDERILGTTPWNIEMAVNQGDVWLLLRKEGFRDRLLRLSLKPGMSIGRHEVLAPLSLPTSGPQRSQNKRGGHRPSSSQIINHLKERLRANPDLGTEADIPESYRIVD